MKTDQSGNDKIHVDAHKGEALSRNNSRRSPRSASETETLLLTADDKNECDSQLVETNNKNSVARTSDSSSSNWSGFFVQHLNRKTMFLAGVAVVVGVGLTAAGAACVLALIALLTSPTWLPVGLMTCPFWSPLALLTSPLWVSGLVLLAIGFAWCVAGAAFVAAVFIFFAWPTEWLPKDSSKAEWFLMKRSCVTLFLTKLQAKLVLHSAGVGPLADATFAIADRIDLVELQKAMADFDLQQWADQVRQMDIAQMQAVLVAAIRSVVGLQSDESFECEGHWDCFVKV